MLFIFTKYARKQWQKFSPEVQALLTKKLQFFKTEQVFRQNIQPIKDIPPATHRLRIGNYRLILLVEDSKKEVLVLKVGHRREIYR